MSGYNGWEEILYIYYEYTGIKRSTVLRYVPSKWTSFLWTCSTPMASDSPSLFLYGVYLHLIISESRTAMMTSTRPEMLCTALSDDYFLGVLGSIFIQQGMSMEGHEPTLLPPAIQTSSETGFKCFLKQLIRFFKVVIVCASLQMHALGLQVKLLFSPLAISICCFVLVIFVYLFTVEDISGCNRLSPLGFHYKKTAAYWGKKSSVCRRNKAIPTTYRRKKSSEITPRKFIFPRKSLGNFWRNSEELNFRGNSEDH